MNKFYIFQLPTQRNSLYLGNIVPYDPEAIFYGRVEIVEPMKMKILKGKKYTQWAYFPDTYNRAICSPIAEHLKASNYTGFKIFDIDLIGTDWKYFGLQFFGSEVHIIWPKLRAEIKGFKFEESTWDGSDFFVSSDTSHVFCTDRVKEGLVSSRLLRLENFLPIQDISYFNYRGSH
jgi:hypothetical protein